MHQVLQAAEKDPGYGFDLPKAQAKEKSLMDAFNAEEQALAIEIAHAPNLNAHQRYLINKPLMEIQPQLGYFRSTKDEDEAFALYNHYLSQLKRRPDFTPSIETARELAAEPGYGTPIALGAILGTPVLMLGGVFLFCAARRRLDGSIAKDEKAIRAAEEEAQKAEEKRKADEAARLAEEAAERERVAKLPPPVELDRDISVRQIKLKNGGA
jgi:hypothetical protein